MINGAIGKFRDADTKLAQLGLKKKKKKTTRATMLVYEESEMCTHHSELV